MIEIKMLFEKYGVICPEWLSEELLEDEWVNSEYIFEDNVHTWILDETPIRYVILSFDGSSCKRQGFDETKEHVIFEEVITEDYNMIT